MNKWKRWVLILSSFGLMNGCAEDNKDRDAISTKASEVAIQYIQKEYNRTMVIEDVEFTSAIGGGTVFVNGHFEDKPKEKVSVTIDHQNDYEVEGVGRD